MKLVSIGIAAAMALERMRSAYKPSEHLRDASDPER